MASLFPLKVPGLEWGRFLQVQLSPLPSHQSALTVPYYPHRELHPKVLSEGILSQELFFV